MENFLYLQINGRGSKEKAMDRILLNRNIRCLGVYPCDFYSFLAATHETLNGDIVKEVSFFMGREVDVAYSHLLNKNAIKHR